MAVRQIFLYYIRMKQSEILFRLNVYNFLPKWQVIPKTESIISECQIQSIEFASVTPFLGYINL